MKHRGLLLALALALLVRIPALVLGAEHYGDAPVRIEIAEAWAKAPHLWRGFAETFQYGPLHLTLIGEALRLLPDRSLAPKLTSLAAGLISIWLLWLLALRLRGEAAALLAALALVFSPLHIQASTTGASEAPFLALLLAAILLEERSVVASALLLGLASLIRYDGWLYIGLVALLILWRTRSLPRAALFFGIAFAPSLLWLLRNWQILGRPLAPITHIENDHHALAAFELAAMGPFTYRLFCLPYWPESVLLIATPVVGLLALAGTARTLWLRERGWELAAIAWIPAAYFTFRGAVLMNFRPLPRFAIVAATLSLPFAWDAVVWLGARLRRPVLALTAVGLVATPLGLALLAYGRDGTEAEWARPQAPISTLPPGIAAAAHWLRANVRKDDVVLLDGFWYFLDIPLAFEANIPEPQLVRVGWTDNFEQRWKATRPTVAVLLEGGKLGKELGLGDRVTFRGASFCRVERFGYAAIYRRCDAATAQGVSR